jgi:hypothetical protein
MTESSETKKPTEQTTIVSDLTALKVKAQELQNMIDKTEEKKDHIIKHLINPLDDKISVLNDDLTEINKAIDKHRYVWIEAKKPLIMDELVALMGKIEPLCHIMITSAEEYHVALIEFSSPIQIEQIKGTDGVVRLSSSDEFQQWKNSDEAGQYIIWKYGIEKYMEVIKKLELIEIWNSDKDPYADFPGAKYCCICGCTIVGRTLKYYQFSDDHIICPRGCLNEFIKRFKDHGIVIPSDKFKMPVFSSS